MRDKINTQLWENIVLNMSEPPQNKTIWAEHNTNTKLSMVLIEFRKHPWMKGVLYNMAHIYGGSDVNLTIVHGTGNKEFVEDIVKDWVNVNLVVYPYENINKDKYSEILTSSEFYEHFKTDFILLFQCDTLIRKRISENFFNYHYVGAPWVWTCGQYNRCVGNGGFSLRNVSALKKICMDHPNSKDHEDQFFVKHIEYGKIPERDEALRFSVERPYYSDPCGLHQTYLHVETEQLSQLLECLRQLCTDYV